MTKKEVFNWLRDKKKTIDVRKGFPCKGKIATFQSGPQQLEREIVKTETGKLSEVLTNENFLRVIPTARTVEDAIGYLRGLYGDYDGLFTAYYLEIGKQ